MSWRHGATIPEFALVAPVFFVLLFAGIEFSPDNELNGIALQGVGAGTTIEYVQVHYNQDDGVEFFGGTASISNFVVSATGDDGLDWDQGWRGSATNFIVDHSAPRSDDPRGIEGDNFSDNQNVEPRSNPSVARSACVAHSRRAATCSN